MGAKKKKKQEKIPRVVPPYWEERDIRLKDLSLFQLRDFCIKLYKTLVPLAEETERLLYRRKKLLWYWRFEHKKLWNEVNESQQLDLRHLRKRFKEDMALMQIRDKKMRCWQATYKSRIELSKQKAVNNMIIHRFQRKRVTEYQNEAHRFDKEILTRIFKHDIMLMESHISTMEGYHRIFYDIGDLMLSNELKYSEDCLQRIRIEEEKLVKQENIRLAKKDDIRRELLTKWETRKNNMRKLYEEILKLNICNRRTIKQKLADVKWDYLLSKRIERQVKEQVDSLPDIKSLVLDEKNQLLDIIELKSFHENKLKRYRKEFHEMDNTIWNLRKENVELINNGKERKEIHDSVKEITMDNIDRTIVMHMGKKILAQIKDNYLVKKIRIFHYVLTELLKDNDDVINNLILEHISEHNPVVSLTDSCEYYDDRTKYNYKKIRVDQHVYDPFQMNLVDDITIRESQASSRSLLTAYKDFMNEKQAKEIDVYHEEPEKLLRTLDTVNSEHYRVRRRLECIFRRNLYNVNSFPIRINRPYVVNDEKYVKEWEEVFYKLLLFYGYDVATTNEYYKSSSGSSSTESQSITAVLSSSVQSEATDIVEEGNETTMADEVTVGRVETAVTGENSHTTDSRSSTASTASNRVSAANAYSTRVSTANQDSSYKPADYNQVKSVYQLLKLVFDEAASQQSEPDKDNN